MVSDKEIEDFLISCYLTLRDVTTEEMEKLRSEIECENLGGGILDGVLALGKLFDLRMQRCGAKFLLEKFGDIDKLRNLIEKCDWTHTKTVPQCPHEYIVRRKCPLTDEEFLYFVDKQRNYGNPERRGPYVHLYLHIDGHKYWTMGDSYEDTVIINRAKE